VVTADPLRSEAAPERETPSGGDLDPLTIEDIVPDRRDLRLVLRRG
jgi:hypothetical protein